MICNIIKNLISEKLEFYKINVYNKFEKVPHDLKGVCAFFSPREVKISDTICTGDGKSRCDKVEYTCEVEIIGDGLGENLYRNIADSLGKISAFSDVSSGKLSPSKVSRILSGVITFKYHYNATHTYVQKGDEVVFCFGETHGFCENFEIRYEINQPKVFLTNGEIYMKSPVFSGKKFELRGKIIASELENLTVQAKAVLAEKSEILIGSKVYGLSYLTDFEVLQKDNFSAEFKISGYAE